MKLLKNLKTLIQLAKVVKVETDGSVHFKDDVQTYSSKFDKKLKRR